MTNDETRMTNESRITNHRSGRCHPARPTNTCASSPLVRHSSFLLLALLPLLIPAQSPSRLEQLEATYQSNLRTIHAPLLQDYIRELELLKSQLIARNRAADAKEVDAEIARVKGIVNTTGVLPYTGLEAAAAPPAAGVVPKPAPADKSPAKGVATALPTLLAAEAFKGGALNAKTGAIPLGSAEWRVFKLPAGTYDVLIIFSSETQGKDEEITLNLGGRETKATIAQDRATGSPETFRLLRLCQIKVETEISGGVLNVTSATADKPAIWLRKVIFAAPKKPAPPAASS